MKGVELASRFSYAPNNLRYCGPDGACDKFISYLKTGENEEELRDILKRFEALNPYLNAISKKHNLDLFDDKVVEAYWIGNELLDSFTDEDMQDIIKDLTTKGLPPSMAEKLLLNLKPGFKPHHSFNVMYVGVGQLTASVETTLPNMENCRVGWGEVIEVTKDKLVVTTSQLKKDDKFFLGEETKKIFDYIPEMMPDVKPRDKVAVHWNNACLTLTEEQLNNLKKYTKLTLDVMNSI